MAVALGIERKIQPKKYFKAGNSYQGTAESTGDLFLPRQPPSDCPCAQRFDTYRESLAVSPLLAQAFDSLETLGWKIKSHCFKGRNDRMWGQTGCSEYP